MRLFKNANFQFIKNRKIAYVIAIIMLLISVGGLVFKGLNWSIDFTGGIAATLNMKPKSPNVKPLAIDKLRSVMSENGFDDAEIQYVGPESNSIFQLKMKSTKDLEETKAELADIVGRELQEYTAGRDIESEVILEVNTVGQKAGSEMTANSILAVVIALILMIIYIWIRFEFTFGLMAILALAFDVVFVLGVFALTGKEVTMQIIAALLTIVGYCINDTIVVFDRIREDLKIYRKDPVKEVFNRAINTTLSRTILTAGTTLITALSLYFFGGAVLHDFALAISLGIIVGTLGSIFLASGLVVDTYKVAAVEEKKAVQKLTRKR
ncbi:MAG: protein translocase subunit SecF [Candidatus Cloacimonetes bacterium]|nr:protein translocase subunit SecF [Candidatus Cloacimonadota bacterium]